MATTPRGIVYPTVGTSLTPLANHFAALATSTDAAITAVGADTGWVNLSSFLTGGFTGTLTGRKVGQVVTLRTNDLTGSIASSTSATTVTTSLPVEWRPNENTWGISVGQNFTVGGALVRNVGTIAIVQNTSTTWTSTRITITFIAG